MKLKDHLMEQQEKPSEGRIRRLMAKSLVEYYIEHMTLREALSALEDMYHIQYDNMPTEVLTKEYNKVFNRGGN